MKRYILIFTGLGLNLLLACNSEGAKGEEDNAFYNPYDTNEQKENPDFTSDTVYRLEDSVTGKATQPSADPH